MAYSNVYANFYAFRQKAWSALGAVWRFRPVRFYLIVALVLQFIAWWEAIYVFRHLSGSRLVLHYNVDFGVDLVSDPARIFLYPVFGLGIVLLNFVLAAVFNHRPNHKLLTKLLFAAADLFGILLILALFSIYLINFS